MAERTLVLSFFADEAAADTAAAALKDSGAASGDAIGILVLDGPMYLNVAKVGARNTATGAGVGAALLLLGPAGLGIGGSAPRSVVRCTTRGCGSPTRTSPASSPICRAARRRWEYSRECRTPRRSRTH